MSPRTRTRLLRHAAPDEAGVDTAIAGALLAEASEAWPEARETFRLYSPRRIMAFGKQDAVAPGYEDAVAAAIQVGYEPILRLAGGRAAVFHEGTLAFSWTIPAEQPRSGITSRFDEVSTLMARAFERLGLDARVGEISGEYCPGTYSVNIGGTHKVMGVGQRLTRRAAHVGGVVVVAGADEVNRALLPVYRAIGFDWRPEATGALNDFDQTVTVERAALAIVDELARLRHVVPAELGAATLQRARQLAPQHLVVGPEPTRR